MKSFESDDNWRTNEFKSIKVIVIFFLLILVNKKKCATVEIL